MATPGWFGRYYARKLTLTDCEVKLNFLEVVSRPVDSNVFDSTEARTGIGYM